jgi:hypothetical protein
MMRGFIVVITAVMAVIFLGRKQYAHHILSLAVIVSAVAIVGLVSVSNSGDSSGSETTVLGVTLLLIAQCFTGGQFVTEEKLLSGYYLDPLLVVGLEGMWGCIYYLIVLPIFQNVSCDNPDLCNNGVIEDSLAALVQLATYPGLLISSIGIVISIACFNATGVAVTKYASAAQRSTIDTCRTLFIWIIQLLRKKETFLLGEAIGFVLLVGGTLVYNEIVVLPIDFMSKNTKANLAKRDS